MFSIAVIIFREIFEIALILGILMAATKGVARRREWVMVGALAGAAGSALLAFFADRISEAAEGMGQEVMNASILLIAASFIGWTLIWMKRHGPELTRQLKAVGRDVMDGRRPVYTLAVVTALTVLREGSEIVMFTYSALVTGGRVLDIVLGLLIGGFMGTAVGMILYYGMARIPVKYIFDVTGWILMFLVAGMAAQAAGYLSAADKLPVLVPVVWDTSAIVPEHSLLGECLKILIGYTQRPSGMQVLVYGGTLLGLYAVIVLQRRALARTELKTR